MTLRYSPAEVRALAWSFDPLRAPETDEEPWLPASPGEPRGFSMFGLEHLAGRWIVATAVVAAALVAVLVVLGIGRAVR